MIRSTSHNNNNSCLESGDNSGVEQLFFPLHQPMIEENILCKVTLDYGDQAIMCIHHFDLS